MGCAVRELRVPKAERGAGREVCSNWKVLIMCPEYSTKLIENTE